MPSFNTAIIPRKAPKTFSGYSEYDYLTNAPASDEKPTQSTENKSSRKIAAPRASSRPAPAFSGYPSYDYMAEQPSVSSGFSGYPEYDSMISAPASAKNAMADYRSSALPLADLSKFLKEASRSPGASPELAKAAGDIPKTKSGLKKFMQDYGQFIALGALAGTGGKGGQIAAPIIAALPGLIEMMKKGKAGSKAAPAASGVQTGMAHGGAMKKSVGGAIRKFKGGSMNMMKDNLTPKYKKGGDMPKGKAAGEMPQHKKMAMGKPTPQSTGQKFAKGGAAKYASGGMCKGYGISKKIRPTGPMN